MKQIKLCKIGTSYKSFSNDNEKIRLNVIEIMLAIIYLGDQIAPCTHIHFIIMQFTVRIKKINVRKFKRAYYLHKILRNPFL